jgi:hypothetical protein
MKKITQTTAYRAFVVYGLMFILMALGSIISQKLYKGQPCQEYAQQRPSAE